MELNDKTAAADKKQREKNALVMFSLSFLENKGLIEKCGYDPKERDHAFCLTDPTQKLLDELVKENKGNRSLSCMELLFYKCARSKENGLSTEALSLHMEVLHLVAFNEKPSKEDADDTGCYGDCELCPDETCPAKDIP